MGLYWTLANALWGFHIFYVVALGAFTFAAAFGLTRRMKRLSLFFFANLAGTMAWQIAPGCPLTDAEKWLRRHVEPGWSPSTPLPESIAERITGADLPFELFWYLGMAWAALAVFGFVRTYLWDLTIRRAPVTTRGGAA